MNINELANSYICEAERAFGKTVSDWSFGGIEINDCPPSIVYYPDTSTVTISLSKKIINDNIQLRFQLAHEVCHTLYPALNKKTLKMERQNILNEGISTFFSIVAINDSIDMDEFLENFEKKSENYYNAFIIVCELIKIDKDAIKKIRTVEPYINRVLPTHFDKANVNISTDLNSKLLKAFI